MRLLEREGDRYRFGISQAERTVLFALLDRYPLIPLSHHRLCRSTGNSPSAEQALLEEAMSARRSQLKNRVRQFIADANRFRHEKNHWQVTLTREEIEWLLQVLNDVRVGNWIRIGCPDPDEGRRPPSTREGRLAVTEMEMAAHFEWLLLEAVEGPLA